LFTVKSLSVSANGIKCHPRNHLEGKETANPEDIFQHIQYQILRNVFSNSNKKSHENKSKSHQKGMTKVPQNKREGREGHLGHRPGGSMILTPTENKEIVNNKIYVDIIFHSKKYVINAE
jgi:hypothetical protein